MLVCNLVTCIFFHLQTVALFCLVQACLGQYYYNGAYNPTAYVRPTYAYRATTYQAAPAASLGLPDNLDLDQLTNLGVDGLSKLTAQLKTMLPASGNVITDVNGVPTVNTKFGAFPLQRNSMIPAGFRDQFLPVLKALVSVFEKEELDPQDANTLLSISRDLTNQLPTAV